MMRFRISLPLFAVAALIATASSAHATFMMRISDGASTLLLQDDTAAGVVTAAGTTTNADSFSGAGKLVFVGGLGNWSFTIVAGQSKPFMGSASLPQMDLGFNVTYGSAQTPVPNPGSLTIEISDTGFTSSPIKLGVAIGGTSLNNITSVKAETDFDNGNVLFGNGSAETSQIFTTTPFSGTASMNVTGATPYSLTERVIISSGAGTGSSSGNLTLTVPAPAGLLLAVSGGPFLFTVAWLRRRQTMVATMV